MPRGRKVSARNVIGFALVDRRLELALPRHHFRWRYRLEQIEGTAKLERALRLLRLQGSEEILETLGFTVEDFDRLAEGEISREQILARARERAPAPNVEGKPGSDSETD